MEDVDFYIQIGSFQTIGSTEVVGVSSRPEGHAALLVAQRNRMVLYSPVTCPKYRNTVYDCLRLAQKTIFRMGPRSLSSFQYVSTFANTSA